MGLRRYMLLPKAVCFGGLFFRKSSSVMDKTILMHLSGAPSHRLRKA